MPLLSRTNFSTLDNYAPAQAMPTIRFAPTTRPSVAHDPHDMSSVAPFAYPAPPPPVPSISAPSPLVPRTNPSPHKRLVPKKSKLGLLASKPKLAVASNSTRSRAEDFSDVVRRVGSSPRKGKGGFEIYVDREDDPELGEIVVVKKQKSRMGLNGMGWGALGEVTNVPNVPKAKKSQENLLKVPKGDENQGSKWWSIGRGKKEMKDKNGTLGTLTTLTAGSTEMLRSISPEPSRPSESSDRTRFNSLGSSNMLTVNEPAGRPSFGTYSSSNTLFSVPDPSFLAAPPPQVGGKAEGGSIAVRAMRSMRSLARMKSWANIPEKYKEGNTHAHTNVTNDTKGTSLTTKTKGKEGKKKKEKKEKVKETKAKTVNRSSGSSFEAGALSPQTSPVPTYGPASGDEATKKKTFGLGLPSTLKLTTLRNLSAVSLVSNASRERTPSVVSANTQAAPVTQNGGLTVGSGRFMNLPDGRRPLSTVTASSIVSSGSSLRPASTASNATGCTRSSRSSSSSSNVSVRWDEDGLRGVKAMQRRERSEARANRRREGSQRDSLNRNSGEGRKRPPVTDIFPRMESEVPTSWKDPEAKANPIVRIQEPTLDGHELVSDSDNMQTPKPAWRARPRPVSDQTLTKTRPRAITDEAEVVKSVSEAAAATHDLANLINWLDLEATPGSTGSPSQSFSLRHSPSTLSLGRTGEGSPTAYKAAKCTFNKDTDAPLLSSFDSRASTASLASLRSYVLAQAHRAVQGPLSKVAPAPAKPRTLDPSTAHLLVGQQIAPWPAVDWEVSPRKPVARPTLAVDTTFRPGHKRTMTPAPADPPVVFQALRPPSRERVSPVISTVSLTPPASVKTAAYPSMQTFGSSKPSKIADYSEEDEEDDDDVVCPPSPSPPTRRRPKHIRHSSRASVLSMLCDSGTPISIMGMKHLGYSGSLGGPNPEVDSEDRDSDIPHELQDILAGQSDEESMRAYDDTWSVSRRSMPPSPGSPPEAPLPLPQVRAESVNAAPVFRASLIDENDNESELDNDNTGPLSLCGSDTGRSFDFTGELQKLSESGASDRLSFVEQLETAFRTPAHVDFNLADRSFLRPGAESLAAPNFEEEGCSTPGDESHLASQDVSETNMSPSMVSAEQDLDTSSMQEQEQASMDTLENLLAECEDFCRPYGAVGRSPESTYSHATSRSLQSAYSHADSRSPRSVYSHTTSRSPRSTYSRASDGQLNTSFRFGGKSSIMDLSTEVSMEETKPLTLSDIIPPLALSAKSSRSTGVLGEEDSSLLQSIYAEACENDKAVADSVLAQAVDIKPAAPRSRVDSNPSSKRRVRVSSFHSSHSRTPSEASFNGLESFEEIRRGFEFANRPTYFPPPGATTSSFVTHGRHESMYSIASVSSYGAVLHPGMTDPFGYASSRPVSMDESSLALSNTVDDTFSFLKKDPHRKRVDSDASMASFQFRRRSYRDSAFSIASGAPPVSLYNRSFAAHRRSSSGASVASLASPMGNTGVESKRSSWTRGHQKDTSIDSMFSDFTGFNIVRPGIGDKMFDRELGLPLEAISGSPAQSTYSESFSDRFGQRSSYDTDSIMDANPRSSMVDSLFDQPGFKAAYDTTEDVFELDESQAGQSSLSLSGGTQFRPVSIISYGSEHSVPKEDDTMISMLDGGRVRRRSLDSAVDHSPCHGRKTNGLYLQSVSRVLQFDQYTEDSPLPTPLPDARFSSMLSPPGKVILSKPSIASTSSQQFGDERMIKARTGQLNRNSLEESALMAQGEQLLASLNEPRVFSRPGRATRSRSSTVTSGTETPPLLSDGSSMSGGSQSSIDIAHLNSMLAATMQPLGGLVGARTARVRARGAGHRRRITEARASRSSVYETIQEEPHDSSSAKQSEPSVFIKRTSLILTDSVYIVDPDSASMNSDWDDEHGIVSMRDYYALRDEAHDTVEESKRVWEDTPFSLFAVKAFQPPSSEEGMKAMLEQSQEAYGPLPSELRPHRTRSRTSSRVSPYPARNFRVIMSPPERTKSTKSSASTGRPFASPAPLSNISINPNINACSPTPLFSPKPTLPFYDKPEKPVQKASIVAAPTDQRQRVTSSTRRSALGWKKRAPKGTAGSANKENKENMRQEITIAPSDSLRISRPRPKGRPATSRKAVTAI